MVKLNHHKVLTLPESLEPNALYFVKNGEHVDQYITNTNGVARRVGNSSLIEELINEAISTLPSASGVEKTYICGENIVSHTPVVLLDNKLYKMDSTNPLHQFAFVGFSKVSGTTNSLLTITNDIITLVGWGLLPGTAYLAGPNGSMLTTNSVANSFTKVIGLAQNNDTLLIIKDYTSVNKN